LLAHGIGAVSNEFPAILKKIAMNEAFSSKSTRFYTPTEFRDLVSGRRRGAKAAMLRGLLALAEVPYAWAVRWRNCRYDCGANHVQGVEVPVISVGNLTLGGTGKTPMVEWIARHLIEQGKKVGIISRGYGAVGWTSAANHTKPTDADVHPRKLNDEALELAWKLPSVPHVQNPDRLAAARRAIDEHGCEVLVLDDAFQHRRIARDLDIVLLDALEPFGYEHVFPRGTLREPVAGLSRAHAIALSRADLLTEPERRLLRSRVKEFAPAAVWLEVIHAPLELIGTASQPLDSLHGHRVLAFCGVGNPAGFRHTLAACDYELVGFQEFPDHHQYSPSDLDFLAAEATRRNAEAVVCTHKDLVKINRDRLGDRPLWAVRIGIQFLAEGDKRLRQLVNSVASPL
jgi:tetraacyldisaccharide 4'-kinase